MAIKVSRPTKIPYTAISCDASGEFENFLLSNVMTVDPRTVLKLDGTIGRAYREVDGRRKLTGRYQL